MNVNYQRRLYPNRLKVIRQNAGYTQKHVSLILGFKHAGLLCDWEKGKTMPSGTNLIKLCIIYGKASRELYPEYYRLVAQDIMSI